MMDGRRFTAGRSWVTAALLAMVLTALAGSIDDSPSLACVACNGCECVEVIGDGAMFCEIRKKGPASCGLLWKFLGICDDSSSECVCETRYPCHGGKDGLTPIVVD